MKVISTNISKPSTFNWKGRVVTTGINKRPLSEGIFLGNDIVQNDEVSDRKYHGGKLKACYMFSADEYAYWKNLYPNLVWDWGMFGENLTVKGLNEENLFIGDIFEVGSAVVQITEPREPCFKLGIKFGNQEVVNQFVNRGYPGTYLRVLRTGIVKPGDDLKLIKKSNNSISTRDFYNLIYCKEKNRIIIQKILKSDAVSKKKKAALSKFL